MILLDLDRPAAHLREIAGLSLSQAAAATGRTISTVHGAERREGDGAQLPSLGTLLARAAAYGLTIEIWVGEAPEDKSTADP